MGKLSSKNENLNLVEKNKNKTSLNMLPKNLKLVKVKFEIYGEEMIDKVVKSSGNSGRIYLPPDWVGSHVKVIRVD